MMNNTYHNVLSWIILIIVLLVLVDAGYSAFSNVELNWLAEFINSVLVSDQGLLRIRRISAKFTLNIDQDKYFLLVLCPILILGQILLKVWM